MNYTLKQLQQRVNKLIEQQGEDAYCGAWIYTKEDCMIRDKDDDEPVYLPEEINSELSERIFNNVGNIDYIYTPSLLASISFLFIAFVASSSVSCASSPAFVP